MNRACPVRHRVLRHPNAAATAIALQTKNARAAAARQYHAAERAMKSATMLASKNRDAARAIPIVRTVKSVQATLVLMIPRPLRRRLRLVRRDTALRLCLATADTVLKRTER